MPVIKQRGAAPKASTRSKASTTKPAAKKGTQLKRSPSKPATKTATRKTGVAKKTTTAKAAPAPQRVNRSPKTDLPQSQLNRLLNPLGKAATQREKLYEQWKEYVAKTNELIMAALDAEVPVGMIVEQAEVSRQHVYKLIGERNAANGSGSKPAAKTTAKRVAKPKPAAAKTTTRKVAAKKPAAKKAAGKRTIRTRG